MSTLSESSGNIDAGANPSSWQHRLPVVALALVGCGVSAYLTLYQWHVTTSVWDPIFGARSSEAVLTSFLSRYLPLPDATLGALAYVVEAIVTAAAGTDRFRTRPRLVILFGLVLVGMALMSIALVLIQVLLIHALCTLCLCSAAISLINGGLGRDEVFASLRSMQPAKPQGRSKRPLVQERRM